MYIKCLLYAQWYALCNGGIYWNTIGDLFPYEANHLPGRIKLIHRKQVEDCIVMDYQSSEKRLFIEHLLYSRDFKWSTSFSCSAMMLGWFYCYPQFIKKKRNLKEVWVTCTQSHKASKQQRRNVGPALDNLESFQSLNYPELRNSQRRLPRGGGNWPRSWRVSKIQITPEE